jgi:hypothetical protein
MKLKILLGLMLCVVLFAGCDADRISKLEKENSDLKTKLEKQSAAENFQLQAKCSKDARAWFNENWAGGKKAILLDFTNHYNAKQNKCFIIVEYHFNSETGVPGEYLWANDTNLYDVYENSKYGEFMENHYTHTKQKFSTEDEMITCEVYGTKCKTQDEFNNLVRPYTSD